MRTPRNVRLKRISTREQEVADVTRVHMRQAKLMSPGLTGAVCLLKRNTSRNSNRSTAVDFNKKEEKKNKKKEKRKKSGR